MTRNTLTDLVFILDRSGSMRGLEKDTIGGFNGMLEKQRQAPGQCRLTTVLFDNEYQLVHDRAPIDVVPPMDERTYYVRGSTALMDAVGHTIQRMVQAQRTARPEDRADHVMFVIITDGYENASQEFTRARVRQMIEYERKRYDWEFIFLGANIDAETAAEAMGIARERAVNYRPDSIGVRRNFAGVSEAACELRANAPIGGSWRADIDDDFLNRR